MPIKKGAVPKITPNKKEIKIIKESAAKRSQIRANQQALHKKIQSKQTDCIELMTQDEFIKKDPVMIANGVQYKALRCYHCSNDKCPGWKAVANGKISLGVHERLYGTPLEHQQ